jgi:hypothetical protein
VRKLAGNEHPISDALICTLGSMTERLSISCLYIWSKVKEARHIGPAAGEGAASCRPAHATQRKSSLTYEVRGVGIQDGGLAPSGNRASVYEAAKVLGVAVDAFSKRIQRGTIGHERDHNGRVWVLMDASSIKPDNAQNIYQAASDELVGELREQISHLREILREEQNARTNAGIATLVRKLQASPEEPTLSVRPPVDAQGDSGGREEPRWRRLFQG